MNSTTSLSTFNPFPSVLDRILAEIAFSIQLPPSLHEKAVKRYKAVREYLERTAAFSDQIEHFYPQGSMAIDATISTRGTDDEYDIDIVAQLGGRFRTMSPCEILDDLYEALKDYQGLTVTRQTRCVTIQYADNMHLDITPALRDYGTADRQSVIAHSKGPYARLDDTLVPMNAYGFALWYDERTPVEYQVLHAFKQYWRDAEMGIRAEAEVDEVPDQTEFAVKNTATLALQLVKRFRNVIYQSYARRVPPSVMLSCFAGYAACPNTPLSDMVIRLCDLIASEIRKATEHRQLLDVVNPRYSEDKFTDRWPEDFRQQDQFAGHLEKLSAGLQRAKQGQMPAWQLQDWLREQFGDRVVTKVAAALAGEAGQAIRETKQAYGRDGGLILPAAPALATPSYARASVEPVKHTFYGKKVK